MLNFGKVLFAPYSGCLWGVYSQGNESKETVDHSHLRLHLSRSVFGTYLGGVYVAFSDETPQVKILLLLEGWGRRHLEAALRSNSYVVTPGSDDHESCAAYAAS